MRFLCLGSLLVTSALLGRPLSSQTVIHVPGNVSTIQGAINVANTGDTVLVAPGTYFERINYRRKAITVESSAGAAATILDGSSGGSVVQFAQGLGPPVGQNSVLRGFTLTHGSAFFGAGIDCGDGSPRIQACIVKLNSALQGGGIWGTPLVEDTLITSNYADDQGGGVWGSATLLRCQVTDNHALNQAGGIWCDPPSQPLIQGCTISGNYLNDAHGSPGGILGNPRLEDCLIERNRFGALVGAPVVVRCTIRNNQGYTSFPAGPSSTFNLGLTGGRIEDSSIVDNSGTIYVGSTSVVLARCVIARNSVAPSGFSSAGVQGLGGRLEQCTIVANIVSPPQPGDTGGVRGPFQLVATILRGNTPDDYAPTLPLSASYSDVGGGVLPGPGNFDLDPLFFDAPSGDYHLLAGSPCVDTGDPLLASDPDGSAADVGAVRFTHAGASTILGSGANPLLLVNVSPPAIGTSWQSVIQAALVPGTHTSGLTLHASVRPTPLATPFGELLIAGPRLASVLGPSNGVQDSFALPIPSASALLGLTVAAQGFVLANPGGLRLGNGLALLLGE